jgi:beta-galactosidase/beta-glucuronidase
MSIKSILVLPLLWGIAAWGQSPRISLDLNGVVEFEQTREAFPPKKFSRTIQVPGLIDLAEPRIDQYDAYFTGTHEPRYSWYRFRFRVPEDAADKFAVLTIRKSRYNTMVILNGHDCGTFMQCNTPITCDLTDHLDHGKENILLVRIGERAWLPKESATGFDREKMTDIPGIWDDVFITFTGPVRIDKALNLPDLKNGVVTTKIWLENYGREVERSMEYSLIEYTLSAHVMEKKSGNVVSDRITLNGMVKCQQYQLQEIHLKINNPRAWSPDDPFLYETVISISADSKYFRDVGNPECQKPDSKYGWLGPSDEVAVTFGMRDFEAVDRTFQLNGEQICLLGSTITLNRFFEDNDRGGLPWDKEWVKKMFIDIPKSLGWNGFRICIGLLPQFWYDLADEHGIMLQNEYPMWNLRGRDLQYMKEYTDWVWTDGNHPSIVIWDAMNEQKENYIGNVVIPSLKELDPTRIWDAGYMGSEDLVINEMDEIHWYPLGHGWWHDDEALKTRREAFRFGTLQAKVHGLGKASFNSSPMILNEYGWLWLNRDGVHSAIRTEGNFLPRDVTPATVNYEYFEPDGTQLYSGRDTYDYYLGEEATPEDRWNFQAYLTAIEGEVLRLTRIFSGIFSFVYLTDNGGYTGDWFKGHIRDLDPSPALLMQYHSHKQFAVFIDLEDGRYLKDPVHHVPGSELSLNLLAVNDSKHPGKGTARVTLQDQDNHVMFSKEIAVESAPFWQSMHPLTVKLPDLPGGYMLLSELIGDQQETIPQVSRRYIIVGEVDHPEFPEYSYKYPPKWPL